MSIFDFFSRKATKPPVSNPTEDVASQHSTNDVEEMIGNDVKNNNSHHYTPREISAMTEPPIAESERKYYNPDEYYSDTVGDGTPWAREIITFSERKKISYPSKGGLYVAEILLLQYCSYGNYPHPRQGYPGFWWFDYGIRNVGAALASLESRGYIEYASAIDSLQSMTVPQLRDLANSYGLKLGGKKADVIAGIVGNIPADSLEIYVTDRKYRLTQKGEEELAANIYVPLMHNAPDKTIEGSMYGEEFNVWSINRILGENDFQDYASVIQSIRDRISATQQERQKVFCSYLEGRAQNGDADAQLSLEREHQIEQIQSAEADYQESGDIDTYIAFWENIWNSGGLLFNGSRWTFRLADLYISKKQYDNALNNLDKITADEYLPKKLKYIEKIEKAKNRRVRS